MDLGTSYAPGSRVRIRGEEWAVEKCLPLPTLGHAVHVVGLSELVRGHQAIFLDTLDPVEQLRPEDTSLVLDPSEGYRQTRLYLETLLRRTPPTDARIHIGHRGAIELMDYQLVPARRALGEPLPSERRCIRPRILIADGTGLGKTIEAGILLSELAKRGKARRILVVAIKSLLAQFQRDLWARFTIPLVRLDSEGIRRVMAKIPSNRNPFSYYDRVIISVDTLKNNGHYRAELEQIRWDVIVVDECQNVANRGSQRESLARLLASQCDSLILTSATPHNGRPESFANLMRMLDPTAIADEQRFSRDDIEHLFVRRFKKDIEAEAASAFKDRAVHAHEARPNPVEQTALDALHAAALHSLGRQRSGVDPLFRWTLIKAFLSSPEACLESIDHRIGTTNKTLTGDAAGPHPYAQTLKSDLARLGELRVLVEAAAGPGRFSKLERLFAELEAIGFDGTERSPRVVIFSERIRTLELLQAELTRRFQIKEPEERIGVFEASLPDEELRKLKESFGREDSPLRVLLASDAASEGVNLHYHCHHLFHFDIPWSLIRLTQRNGRIDRFGQRHTPNLHYLVTRSKNDTADQQVIRRLIDRESVVYRQLGDAGALLGLYDADAEDDRITRGVAMGEAVTAIIPDEPEPRSTATRAPAPPNPPALPRPAPVDDGTLDLFAILDGTASEPPAPVPTGEDAAEESDQDGMDLVALLDTIGAGAARPLPAVQATSGLPSLFAGDYELALTALRQLQDQPVLGSAGLEWDRDDSTQSLRIYPPESFRQFREEFLPREAVPDPGEPYQLTADQGVVFEKIRQALESDDGQWPAWHLLWEQHPLIQWMLDALSAAYARHEAPVLIAPRLGKHQALYLFSTLVSNEDSQPVHTAWFSVEAEGANVGARTLSLEETLETTGFPGAMNNPGRAPKHLERLTELVPHAVQCARSHLEALREPSLNTLRAQVRKETRRLEQWQSEVLGVIARREERYSARHGKVPAHLERQLNQERQSLERFMENHARWLKSLSAHGAPYLRLVAVFTGA
jgi:ERCC4-related helicase